mgnify:CR=1 FL=1|jgi:hypothetical protein|tara:strand:- start:546 stop:722 length:177 start_codon:yes stop_codon:yes gene_type:complete
MKLIVILWIMNIFTLQGEKNIYNGTIDDCLNEAIAFNTDQQNALAGCYMEVKKSEPNY